MAPPDRRSGSIQEWLAPLRPRERWRSDGVEIAEIPLRQDVLTSTRCRRGLTQHAGRKWSTHLAMIPSSPLERERFPRSCEGGSDPQRDRQLAVRRTTLGCTVLAAEGARSSCPLRVDQFEPIRAVPRWEDAGVQAIGPCEPWAFTQERPLTTSDFAKEAQRRGHRVDNEILRELWRAGALAPIAQIRNRPVGGSATPSIPEPASGGTWVTELRLARDAGRLADPHVLAFRHQVRFDPRPDDSPRQWWNGLIYSRWQLIALDRFSSAFAGVPRVRREGKQLRLRRLADSARNEAAELHRLVHLLIAIEARYLPTVRRGWLHLVNATVEEWELYRQWFDPLPVITRYGWTPEQVVDAAEHLLLRAARQDPLHRQWSALIRRARAKAWEDLSGEIVGALDKRMAAELLLLCYEDLAKRGEAAPLEEAFQWSSSEPERVSHASESLDGLLSSLGLSPHPGVVLVVEGETEELLVPRVRDRLRLTDQTGIVRSAVMRGTKTGLTKLVGFAAGPVIERREGNHWLLAKPPTYVMVAVDPDTPFDGPDNVERERRKMIDEIVAVVRAQGVEPDREDLEGLVQITTWSQACFEFAHFTDDELAAALRAVHPNTGGLSAVELVEANHRQRSAGNDLRHAWKNWRPTPSKRALAEELWPILEGKISAAEADEDVPIPEVVLRVEEAHHRAADRRSGRWVLGGHPL